MGKKREDEMQSILTRLLIIACVGLPVSIYLVYDHWNPQEQYGILFFFACLLVD